MSSPNAFDYLNALYGRCSSGRIVFCGPEQNRVAQVFDVSELKAAAQFVESCDHQLFIKVNPIDYDKTLARSKYGTGQSDEVVSIVSIHLDVDANKSDKYGAQEHVLAIVVKMPLKPSLILLSDGDHGGFHIYWLLALPFEITSEAARILASRISKRWESELRRLAGDTEVDKTGDIARLLRPLGSVRNSGNRVKVHTWNPQLRYSLEDFELPPLVSETKETAEASSRSASGGVISDYLDHVGLWSPQDVLKCYSYKQWKSKEGFYIRPNSSSGMYSCKVFSNGGTPGVTFYSAAAHPFEPYGWYTREALYVGFEEERVDKAAFTKVAQKCHEYFDSIAPKVNFSAMDNQPLGPAPQPRQKPESKPEAGTHPEASTSQQSNTSSQSGSKPNATKEIKVRARRMSDVQSEKIDWWWPGKIPRANLIIFAGQGGCGKSSVCCDLIARHTTGMSFPNDSAVRQPENVAIINCEDDAATIQRPRLDAAGADCSRVHLLDDLELNGNEAWIDFSNFAKPVEDFITANEITLLIIDPISGHMGNKKQNDTPEVREVLQKLQAMAKRTGCTIIAITHSPKSAHNAQGAVIGSQAFVSCARAAFAFVVDKDDPKRRIMLNAKNNYSADESGLAYRIEDQNGVGRVEWDQEPVTDHPDTFFTPTSQGEHGKQKLVDKVASMLADFLTEAKPSTEVEAWARAHKISSATLRRAKDKNEHPVLKGEGGKWYWLPVAGATMW